MGESERCQQRWCIRLYSRSLSQWSLVGRGPNKAGEQGKRLLTNDAPARVWSRPRGCSRGEAALDIKKQVERKGGDGAAECLNEIRPIIPETLGFSDGSSGVMDSIASEYPLPQVHGRSQGIRARRGWVEGCRQKAPRSPKNILAAWRDAAAQRVSSAPSQPCRTGTKQYKDATAKLRCGLPATKASGWPVRSAILLTCQFASSYSAL
jgi:hypothetical protein